MNYHSLANFQTQHEAWLNAQLTRSVASLLDRRLVSTQVKAQVQVLKRELAEDAGDSVRRKQAAIERAARECEQRLAAYFGGA